MRGAPTRARHLLLLPGRRCALPPSNCTWSSAASNSGAATSSKQGGAPRALGVCRSQVPGGERGAEGGTKEGAGGDNGAAGEGGRGSRGSAGAQRGPGSRGRQAGRAARGLLGAVGWERRYTPGRQRAGLSSHTLGPGCH